MTAGYFDHNATTPVLPQVLEAMRPYFTEAFGNPSTAYRRGREALAAIQKARQSVAKLLGCRDSEVVFTAGGSEGDNHAIRGIVADGDHIITSVIEHSAVEQVCRYLEQNGCQVTRVPVNGQGQVDPEAVRRALRPNTRLITIMMANNETGVLQPVEEIGQIAAEADVWFHIDAVQAAGKVPVAAERLRCDLLAISGHKIYAPQGVGALYVRRGTPLKPFIRGGSQEQGRRAGTENVPGIVGLGVASEMALAGLEDGTVDRIRGWRDRFENSLLVSIDNVTIHAAGAPRVANTSSVYFEYLRGEALAVALDLQGISVSSGSACHAGSQEPSRVLLAMGLTPEQAHGTLRFSLGKTNQAEDIDHLLSVLPAAVQRLRDLSPVYPGHGEDRLRGRFTSRSYGRGPGGSTGL